MFRITLGFVCAALFCVPTTAEEKKPAIDLTGLVADRDLQKEAPKGGTIVSQKGWDKLVKAWDIKDAPKVDFTKDLLIVATTVGSRLNVSAQVDDKGDLKITALATDDLRPGFKYVIKSFSRAGVKTINGQELPKE